MLLAEAVHDDPIHRIITAAALRMDVLGAALPAEQTREVDELAGMLETALDRLRTLIVALTPLDLTRGLGMALHDVAEGIFVGTTVTISLSGVSHVGLGASTKATAYRIVREALVNARKHAHAKTITLHVEEAAAHQQGTGLAPGHRHRAGHRDADRWGAPVHRHQRRRHRPPGG